MKNTTANTYIILLFVIYLSLNLYGKEAFNRNLLSYKKFQNLIKNKSLTLKINNLQAKKAENNSLKLKAKEDLYLEGSYANNKTKYYMSNPYYSEDYHEGYEISLSLKKKFVDYGTSISSELNYSKYDFTGTGAILQKMDFTGKPVFIEQNFLYKHYMPHLSFSMQQPLWQNYFGKLDKLERLSAENKIEIAHLIQKQKNNDLLNFYHKLYFHWYLLDQKISLVLKMVLNTRKIESESLSNYKSKLIDNSEYQKSKTNVLNYQEMKIVNEIEFKNLQQKLNAYIDLSQYRPDQKDFNNMYKQCINDKITPLLYYKTLRYQLIAKSEDDLQAEKLFNQVKLNPEFNVFANLVLKNDDSAFNNSMNLKDLDYSIGFICQKALENTQVNAKIEEIELKIKENKYRQELLENEYLSNIYTLTEKIHHLKSRLTVKRDKLKSLNSIYNTEKKKFKQAKINTISLLKAKNEILKEKINIINLKTELIIYYLDFKNISKKS
ncbi:TolC family protein [Candidatus Margulisiibacteriota bacterium]